MIYRAVAGGIVVFWLAMTALFLRTELYPERRAAWLEIPPAQVLDLLFLHQENSELFIHSGGTPLGVLHVVPRIPEDGLRHLDLRGDFLLRIPGMESQRAYFGFSFQMESDNRLRGLDIDLSLRRPAFQIAIHIDPVGRSYHSQTFEGDTLAAKHSGTFDSLLAEPALESFGIGPEQIQARASQLLSNAPELTARTGELRMGGEKIAVFFLTIKNGESGEIRIAVNQIGRVLRVDTPFDIRLLAQGLDR